MNDLDADLVAAKMGPYLYAVELTESIHWPLLRLQVACKKFQYLWNIAVVDSSIATVCIHSKNTISIRGAISLSDFCAYLKTAMHSVVVHPCEMCSSAMSRIPQLQGLRRAFPPQRACTVASTSALTQFIFEQAHIVRFLTSGWQAVPRVCSTAHGISMDINGLPVSLMDVSLLICYEPSPHMTTEVRITDGSSTASVHPREVRISCVIFGLEIANSKDWKLSSVYDVSSDVVPGEPCQPCESESSLCVSAGLAEALEKMSGDLCLGCLVDIEVVFEADDEQGYQLPAGFQSGFPAGCRLRVSDTSRGYVEEA